MAMRPPFHQGSVSYTHLEAFQKRKGVAAKIFAGAVDGLVIKQITVVVALIKQVMIQIAEQLVNVIFPQGKREMHAGIALCEAAVVKKKFLSAQRQRLAADVVKKGVELKMCIRDRSKGI